MVELHCNRCQVGCPVPDGGLGMKLVTRNKPQYHMTHAVRIQTNKRGVNFTLAFFDDLL